MKLKFNSDAWYNGELLAKAGEIKEISEELGFAVRWIKRGAEEVKEEVKEEAKEEVVSLIQEVDNLEVKEQNKKGKNSKGK